MIDTPVLLAYIKDVLDTAAEGDLLPDQEVIIKAIREGEGITFEQFNASFDKPFIQVLLAAAESGYLKRTFRNGRYRYEVTAKGVKFIDKEMG